MGKTISARECFSGFGKASHIVCPEARNNRRSTGSELKASEELEGLGFEQGHELSRAVGRRIPEWKPGQGPGKPWHVGQKGQGPEGAGGREPGKPWHGGQRGPERAGTRG